MSGEVEHIEVLKALSSLDPRPFLMGGFAEDALLHGRVTRERNDLDLLVDRADWPEVSRRLQGAGFRIFEPFVIAPDGETVALASEWRGLPVEAWLCDSSVHGYRLVLPGDSSESGSPVFFRLLLPADTFAFPAAELDGVAVLAVSPRALALLRAASAQTRGTDEKRASDLEKVAQLARRFLPDENANQLVPQLTRLK